MYGAFRSVDLELAMPLSAEQSRAMANTEFANARFKAEDNEGPTQFIGTLENGPATNTVLHDKASFRLKLKAGHTFEQAQSVADFLNEHIDGLSVTTW